jgi:hypothetical protein
VVSFAYSDKAWNGKDRALVTLVKANPNNTEIRNQFLKYTNGGLAVLEKRRQAEADLYFKKISP